MTLPNTSITKKSSPNDPIRGSQKLLKNHFHAYILMHKEDFCKNQATSKIIEPIGQNTAKNGYLYALSSQKHCKLKTHSLNYFTHQFYSLLLIGKNAV